jgi:hypothetical protein
MYTTSMFTVAEILKELRKGKRTYGASTIP